jgi:dipeptidyl aminopeptidase/acylaminoacyl peptidase
MVKDNTRMTLEASEVLARYAAAEAALDTNVARLVLNENVAPNWVGAAAFWYRHETAGGCDYVWVEADGRRRPAFDHEAVARALAAATDTQVAAAALDVQAIAADGEVTARVGGRRFAIKGDAASETTAALTLKPSELPDPSGRRVLFARDHDLWLRDIATGEEQRLTDDGVEDFSWGQYPDWGLLGVVRRRSGLPFAPFGWSWSPDGAWLVGMRVDERNVEPYPFVEMVPQDGGVRPRVYSIRQALVGEPSAKSESWAIEVATGKRVRIVEREEAAPIEPLAWSSDGRRFIAISLTAEGREVGLVEIDVTTGKVRTIHAERPPGYVGTNSELYNQPNVRVIKGGAQAIWYSERSGWGHLYRYDCASGALVNAITSGDWLVRDILWVDEGRERVFFTGSGREPGNPYYRRVYRVNLDGSELVLLTPDDADHTIDGAPIAIMSRLYGMPTPPSIISPDGSVFVESHSIVEAPGSSTLRSTEDGRVIAELERADATALFATGWAAPEQFVAKAADGETELYGVLYRPAKGAKLPAPVIDSIYGGPQVNVVPRNFRAGRRMNGGYGRAALTKLGFAVMVVDSRGTPQRSRAFHDVAFANFADIVLDDHVAVLRQLCERDPTLDGERIGVFGHSFGGYTSARAVLRHPDVYKVAVSSAGSHSIHSMYAGTAGMFPPADYGGGLRVKPDVRAVPENYRVLDSAIHASNLTGKLLLAYGDMDENAYPAVTLLLYDALIKANRSPDLLCLPNRTHGFPHEAYFVRRLWDYFVTHLLGEKPPQDYQIGANGVGGFA